MTNAFIHCRANGTVAVDTGLIFINPRQTAIQIDYGACGNEFSNLYVICQLPRWWQLRGWLRILRTLQRYTR